VGGRKRNEKEVRKGANPMKISSNSGENHQETGISDTQETVGDISARTGAENKL